MSYYQQQALKFLIVCLASMMNLRIQQNGQPLNVTVAGLKKMIIEGPGTMQQDGSQSKVRCILEMLKDVWQGMGAKHIGNKYL